MSHSVISENGTSSDDHDSSPILMISVVICIGVVAVLVMVLMVKQRKKRMEGMEMGKAAHIPEMSLPKVPATTSAAEASHVVEISVSTM